MAAGQCCEHCTNSSADHDLLTVMSEQIKNIAHTVRELKQSKAGITDLTTQKEDGEKVHKDHESRLRRLESWAFIGIGAILFLDFGAKILDAVHAVVNMSH